jgi:hypothetical protein
MQSCQPGVLWQCMTWGALACRQGMLEQRRSLFGVHQREYGYNSVDMGYAEASAGCSTAAD